MFLNCSSINCIEKIQNKSKYERNQSQRIHYNLYHKAHEMEFRFKKPKRAPLCLPKYIQGKNLSDVHIAVRTYLSSRG